MYLLPEALALEKVLYFNTSMRRNILLNLHQQVPHSLIHSLTHSLTHSQLLIGISAANIEGMTYHTKLIYIPKSDDKMSYTNVAFGNEENIQKINFKR